MKKITLLLSAVLLACATNLWAGDVVVYKLNTATTTIATNNKYVSVNATPCASDDKTSEVTTANWKITLGSNQSNDPKGLWLGANSSNKSNEKLGNGSFAEANAIATAVGATTSSTCYAALISETELPNISKIKFSYAGVGGKNPEQIWILASGDKGTTWSVVATSTKMVAAKDTTFALSTTIASSRYALVCCHKSDYFTVRVPVLTFYKTVSETKTVSVAVAKGQEEMGSVVMSYKANSEEAWTEATESAVEIAGEGAEVFQFVATPADGYKFAGWTTTGDITLNDKNAATAVGESAKETSVVTAHFERDATLQSLTISGTATKVTYVVGDTFDPAGLVVTATYSDGATDKVTDQVSWTFDPETFAEAGTASVTVTATIDAVSAELTISDIVVVDVDKYALVTNSTLLADGQHIIIVDANKAKALSTTQNKNNRGAVAITIEDGLIVDTNGVEVITLDSIMDGETVKWELQVTGGFLYAASNSSNQLKTRENNSDAKGQWTISIDAKGVATVKASGATCNWMQYNSNNGSPIFSCYENKQEDIAIYARQYTVTVEFNDENMGTVTGGGKYFENNVATLVATPKEGYKLTGWSNNSELTKNEQSLVVTENITITAYFAKGETAIDCTTLAPEVVKTIENGQLVILRDGVKYNAMGVRLQ